ncbi:hypothetical protein L1987_88361 [Smallanthus sonchifolius]|nr:hypothetical protein L1987_88361 [Smallanthus sonchifolius]
MAYTEFLRNTVSVDDLKKKDIIIDFWKEFYTKNFETYQESKTSNRFLYKDKVMQILYDFKKMNQKPYSDEALRKLQLEIETLTIMFDEESIHITCNHIMKEIIDPKKESAKDYVLERITSDLDKSIVSDMGQYTLEAIIVYVISLLYSSDTSMIRVSTLIDQLDTHVRSHSILINTKYNKKIEMKEVGQKVVLGEHYPIGVALIEFIVERGLMTIQLMDDKKSEVPIQKKKGKYYLPKLLYAIYNFDISLLPLKLNLPMICKPVDWQSACGGRVEPKTLSDLKGGYLSGISEYSRYKLLTQDLREVLSKYVTKNDSFELADICYKFWKEAYKNMTSVQDPHPGLIIASLNFKKPYPGVEETELLSLSTLDMLNQYVYPSISGYELYNGSCLVQVIIRAYMDQEEKLDRPELKVTDRYQELLSIYQTELGEIEAITARKIQHSKRKFDGVLILKHLVCHHDYKLKPLFRNNMLYELSVYSGRKVLFRLRDSLNLLPGTLNNLAKSLCPSLGSKGSIDYHDVRVDNLVTNKGKKESGSRQVDRQP